MGDGRSDQELAELGFTNPMLNRIASRWGSGQWLRKLAAALSGEEG